MRKGKPAAAWPACLLCRRVARGRTEAACGIQLTGIFPPLERTSVDVRSESEDCVARVTHAQAIVVRDRR